MKILVTGSNGYLGTVLVPTLVNRCYDVVPLDLGLFESKSYLKVDLSSDSLDFLNNYGITHVVHLAGISNDPSCELHPDLTYRMNILATENLINWSKKNKIEKFVFASSASVYGISDKESTEYDVLNPQSEYAESKIISERMLMESKLNYSILRFGTLFGYSDKMRLDLAVNLMSKNIATEGKVHIFGDGKQYRPFLFIYDACRAILNGLKFKESILTNVVTHNIEIYKLAEMLADHFMANVIYDGTSNDNRNYRLSKDKMERDFNFRSDWSLIAGALPIYTWAKYQEQDLNKDEYYTIRMWKKYYKEYLNG